MKGLSRRGPLIGTSFAQEGAIEEQERRKDAKKLLLALMKKVIIFNCGGV